MPIEHPNTLSRRELNIESRDQHGNSNWKSGAGTISIKQYLKPWVRKKMLAQDRTLKNKKYLWDKQRKRES